MNNSTSDAIRLLLVEDHDDTRNSMVYLLRRYRYQVESAATGGEALAIADKESFDLVVADLGLPDMHGCELMSVLSDRHGLVGIAASGNSQPEDIEACRKAGFIRHITKPFDMPRLRAAIADCVGSRQSVTGNQ